ESPVPGRHGRRRSCLGADADGQACLSGSSFLLLPGGGGTTGGYTRGGPVSNTSLSERTPKRILIACIGNIFLGDDGFGVEVAKGLTNRHYPEGVKVVDFGIRGIELAYTLLDDYDALVLVDAVPRGGEPGTLYLIEPDLTNIDPEKGAEAGRVAPDAHS